MKSWIHFDTEFHNALLALTQNQPYASETSVMQLDNKDVMTNNNLQISSGDNRIYIEDNCIKWYCNIYKNKVAILLDANGEYPIIHTTRYKDTHGIVFKRVDAIMNKLLQIDQIDGYAYSSFD